MINFAVLAPVIKVVLSLAKKFGYEKVPRRWRWLAPIVLGAVAGVVDRVALGASWQRAVLDLFAGLGAIGLHESIESATGHRDNLVSVEEAGG